MLDIFPASQSEKRDRRTTNLRVHLPVRQDEGQTLPRDAMVTRPDFGQLERAASHILRLINDTPGLKNVQLVLSGDLAVCKYLPQHDPNEVRFWASCLRHWKSTVANKYQVQSIEIILGKTHSPGRLRKEIVGHPMSPLVEISGGVYYRSNNGWEIEVKFTPEWVCPYMPASVQPVQEDASLLPYIILEDLIVFKMDAYSLRDGVASKRREAASAAALLEVASKHSPLVLEESKMDRVDQALADVAEESLPGYDKTWWYRRFGKPIENPRSAQAILSDLADIIPSSTPTSPTSSLKSPMSRASSFMSASSTHTSTSSISSITSSSSHGTVPEKNGRPRKMSAATKTPRHKRHISSGGTASTPTLDASLRQLDLGRSASPGITLTNKI